MRKRSPRRVVVTFFLALALVTAFDPSMAWSFPRDAFVSSGIGDARVLIPFLADDTTSSMICGMVYNGLTKVDRNLEIVGDLAESWEIGDGGKDIVFYLKKDVKWHDGIPFTSEDVKFTYELILSPETGCPYISSYKDIDRIETPDKHTVRFILKRPYVPIMLKLGMGIVPEHIFKDIEDLRRSGPARAPVGTGPYVFERWETGRFIVLKANKSYHEGSPNIRRFVFRIIPDQSVQYLELISGGIDSMELNPYQFVYRSDNRDFKKAAEKYKYLAHSYTYIGYNLKDPILSDERIRKALSYAVNKDEIIESVLFGMGEPCTGPMLKSGGYYDESVRGYPYNPSKAALLLREAGWYDADDDGVLEKEGKELSISIITNQGNQVREDVATIVQGQWKKLGVRTEIKVIAWSAFLDQFVNPGNFQAILLGWSLPIDPDLYSVWHSSSASGGLNFISYTNDDVDGLIERGRREFDPSERKKIYKKIHRMISEEAPYTFLFFPYAAPSISKRFTGIETAPAGIFYDFNKWEVPEDKVRYRF